MDTFEEPNRATAPGSRPAILPFPSSSAYLQGYTNFGHSFDDDEDDEQESFGGRNATDATVAEGDYDSDGPYRYEDDENEYDTEDYSAYSDFSVEELHEFMLQQQQQSLLEYACSARRYSLLETIREETLEELLESRSEVSDYSGVWCWGDDFTDGAESVIYVENARDFDDEEEEDDRDVDEEEWNQAKAFDNEKEWRTLKVFDDRVADIRLDCEPNHFDSNVNSDKCCSIRVQREDENDATDNNSPFSSWSDPSDREGSWLDCEGPAEEECVATHPPNGSDDDGEPRGDTEQHERAVGSSPRKNDDDDESQHRINNGNPATVCRSSSSSSSDDDDDLMINTAARHGSTAGRHTQGANFEVTPNDTATSMEVSYIKTVLQESLCGNIATGGIRSIACPSDPDLADRDLLIVFETDEPQRGKSHPEVEAFTGDASECLSWSDAIDAYLMSLAIEPSSNDEQPQRPEPRSSGVGIDRSDLKNSKVATAQEYKANVQWKSCNRSSILNSDHLMGGSSSSAPSTEIKEASNKKDVANVSSVPHARICTLESPSSLMCGDDATVDFDHLGLERTAGDGAEEQQPPICPKTADTLRDAVHFFAKVSTTRKSVSVKRLVGTKSAPDLFDVQIMREEQEDVDDNDRHRRDNFGYGQFGANSLTDDDFASRSQSEPCVSSGDGRDADGPSSSPTSPKKSRNFGDFDFVYGGDLTTSTSLKQGRLFGSDGNDDDLPPSTHRLISKERSTFSFSSKSFDSQFTSSEDESIDSSSDDDRYHTGTDDKSGSLTRTRVLFPRFTPPGTLRSFRSFDALNLAGTDEPLRGPEECHDVGTSASTARIGEEEEEESKIRPVSSGHSWMDGIEEESSELEAEKIRPSSEDLSEDSGYSDIRGSSNALSVVPHPVVEEKDVPGYENGTPRQRLEKLLFNDTERRDRTLGLSSGSGQNLGQTDEISSTNISALNEIALCVHEPDNSEEENRQKDELAAPAATEPITRKLEQLAKSKMQKAENVKSVAPGHTRLRAYAEQVNEDQSGTLKCRHQSSPRDPSTTSKTKQTFVCETQTTAERLVNHRHHRRASEGNVKAISDTEWNVEVSFEKGTTPCPTLVRCGPTPPKNGVWEEEATLQSTRVTTNIETESYISKNNIKEEEESERAFSCKSRPLQDCLENKQPAPEVVHQTLAGQQYNSWKQTDLSSDISSVSYCGSDGRSGVELDTNDKHTSVSVCSQSDWLQVGSVSKRYAQTTCARLVVVSTAVDDDVSDNVLQSTTVKIKLPINTNAVGAPCQGEPVFPPTPSEFQRGEDDDRKPDIEAPKQRVGSVTTVRVVLKRIDPLPKKEDGPVSEPFGYSCEEDESKGNDTRFGGEKLVALNRTERVQRSPRRDSRHSGALHSESSKTKEERSSVGVCNLEPPNSNEKQKAFGPELMWNQREATSSDRVFNSTSDPFSESTSAEPKHAEDADDKVPFREPPDAIKQSREQVETAESNNNNNGDKQMENNKNNVPCQRQWTLSLHPSNGRHGDKDAINNNNVEPVEATVEDAPTRPPRQHSVARAQISVTPMDAKPPLPPSVVSPRHVALCRTRIINARQQFFDRGADPTLQVDSRQNGAEEIDETLERFRQRAREGRERVAKSVSDLNDIERAFATDNSAPSSTSAHNQQTIIDRSETSSSSDQSDSTCSSSSITNAEKSTATTAAARAFASCDGDAFLRIQTESYAIGSNENGHFDPHRNAYSNVKRYEEDGENSPPKRPPRRADVHSPSGPQKTSSSSPPHQSGWNSRERSPSIGYLETDIDTLHSREVIRICDFEDAANQSNAGGGPPLRPSRHNSPSGKPPRPPHYHHLKTRSMFNLMESNGGDAKSTPTYETQLSNTTADSDDQSDDVTSRAKSMEFLLKDENKLSVLPPENQLQQMLGSFQPGSTEDDDGGGRAMSEHELRIRRSLQKLNLPEWYKNSPLGQMGSTEGLLLRRQQRHNAERPTTTRWQDLRSRSTSASSLGGGGGGVGPPLQRHSAPNTGKTVVIQKRVATPDWRYVKSSRESLLQSPMSPSPSPSLTDRSFQYYYNSTALSRWSSSRLSSTTASSRSTSPTGSAQCRSPFQRQPYLGWRSSERLTRERTNSGTDNASISSTPTHGFYRSAAERLSQGPGYYALRFGLYRSPGSDGNLVHGGARRGSNSAAPPNELTTRTSPTADRIPNYQSNHPEITVNVFEPNGYSEHDDSRDGSPPEHVRVAAELVREIDKMISRNNGDGNHRRGGALLGPEPGGTSPDHVRHPSPIEVRAVEADHGSANSSPKSSGSGKQQKVAWVESSFVGVRPVRVADTPTEEAAAPHSVNRGSVDPGAPSLVYRDAPTSSPPPLLNKVAEETPSNERRLSLTSTTLEEVLDSLLALPSSSQSPSPSGYRTGQWDSHDTSAGRRTQGSISDQQALEQPSEKQDPLQPSPSSCPEQDSQTKECLRSSSGESSQATGGCSGSSSGSVSSRSSEASSNRVAVPETNGGSSSSTDLTTATTTVESSNASSIRGTDSSSPADVVSSSGNSRTSSISGSSGKEVIPPPPGFLDPTPQGPFLPTGTSRSSSSAHEGVTTASPLARTAITSSFKHSGIGPLHETEDESSRTPSSESVVHDDDDSFPPPPTHHELMQLTEQHNVETLEGLEECDSRRHSTSTDLSQSNILQEISADELPAEDELTLTPAEPEDAEEPRGRRCSGARQDQLDDTVVVRCSHHRCDNTAELRDARKSFKTCHNCYTYYCSRECRKSHWDRHRHVCMYGRIRSMCKQAIQYARDNPNILNHLSRLARTGYLTQGRGFVKILFRNTDLAMHFLRHGWSQLEDGPIYVSWKDLLPQEMGAEVYRAVLDLSKHYDAELKFVLLVAVFITREVPMQSVPHWEREIIAKCAKVPLAKSIAGKDGHGFVHDDPNTMILTGPQPPKGGDPASTRTSREVCLANIEERLSERGVSLRHQLPDVYQRLCLYVDRDDPFPPLTIYPKDGLTGQTFMCVIMPNSGPQLHDWWMSPAMARKPN